MEQFDANLTDLPARARLLVDEALAEMSGARSHTWHRLLLLGGLGATSCRLPAGAAQLGNVWHTGCVCTDCTRSLAHACRRLRQPPAARHGHQRQCSGSSHAQQMVGAAP